MKQVNIRQKLESMGVNIDSIVLGDFDVIGEFTAKRQRSRGEPNYNKFGAFFRANFERGLLIYYLVQQYQLTSMLEIGFGRGYSTFCAAKAFYDLGISGQIVSIDPAIDEKFLNSLQQVFPQEWFKYIKFAKCTSQQALPAISDQFDLVYIDGDHSYEGTKFDWENSREKCSKFVLFDDYHLPQKDDPGIQCRQLIDSIDYQKEKFEEPELIKMDRMIFFDDRRYTEDQVDYGQVLFTREGLTCRDDW
jgi:hypothetical protein